jgi:2-dehydro-3-deoxygluconokinase
MKHRIVTFGEIMLRLTTPGHRRFGQAGRFDIFFGGGEANVAVSLARFGMNSRFVSRIPDNDIGDHCIGELKKHDVETTFIKRSGERLGIYYLETGAVNRASKVIYDRSHSAFSQLESGMINWDEIFKDAGWFHWTGITPALSQGTADVCREAVKAANEKGITVSCDLNYRSKLWKYGKKASEIMPDLVAGCDIVIGNEEDAGLALGISPDGVEVTKGKLDADAYLSVSREIIRRFPKVKKVATTLRTSVSASHNRWSAVLYNGAELLKAPVYDIIPIVDRVGAGDAFAAGLIFGLLSFDDDRKALGFATAASSLKHTVPGDFNLVTVDEVEKLMKGDASGRVMR